MSSELFKDVGKKIFYPQDYHSIFLKNLIVNGIDLKQKFKDFDPLNKFKVTRS